MLEVRLLNCSGENAGVSTVLVEPQVQTYVSALLCLINTPYQLLGLAGSTGFLVWWCYYIGCETLSCQGALPGGSGGCRNSGEELKERFLDLEETSKPIKLNPICHFIVEKTWEIACLLKVTLS